MLRKFVFSAILIISYIIQTTLKSSISPGNITPNLLLIAVTSIALLRGRKEGMYAGFFAGLFLDLFYGYSDIIGLSIITYMYIGYFLGIVYEIIYINDIIVPIILTGIMSIMNSSVYYFIAFLLRNKLDFPFYFKNIIVPEMVFTVFLTVFLFKLYKYINTLIEAYEKRGEKKYGKRDLRDLI